MIRVVEVRENTACPACRVRVYPDGRFSDPACDQCGARYHAECVGLADGEARRPCGCAGDESERDEARERVRAELLARLGKGASFARAEEAEAEALSTGLLSRDVLPDEDELTQAARAAWGAELMSRGELYLLSDSNGTVMARAADVDERAAEVAARAARWAVRYALGGEDPDEEGRRVEHDEDNRGSVGKGPARRRAASLAWDHWPDCLGDVDGGPLSAWGELTDADEVADLVEALIDTGRIDRVDARRAADVVLTASEATTRDRWGRAFLSRRSLARLRRELEQWLDRDAGRELLEAVVVGA